MVIFTLVMMLLASIGINTFCIWYIVKLLKQLLFVSDRIGDVHDRIKEYQEHCKIVYELESYYGDEIIKNLIIHSNAMNKYMDQFTEIENYSKDEPEEEEINEEETDEFDTDPAEEERIQEEKTKRLGQSRKNVFYSGS